MEKRGTGEREEKGMKHETSEGDGGRDKDCAGRPFVGDVRGTIARYWNRSQESGRRQSSLSTSDGPVSVDVFFIAHSAPLRVCFSSKESNTRFVVVELGQ